MSALPVVNHVILTRWPAASAAIRDTPSHCAAHSGQQAVSVLPRVSPARSLTPRHLQPETDTAGTQPSCHNNFPTQSTKTRATTNLDGHEFEQAPGDREGQEACGSHGAVGQTRLSNEQQQQRCGTGTSSTGRAGYVFKNLPASVWWIHYNEPNTRDLASGAHTLTLWVRPVETNGNTG